MSHKKLITFLICAAASLSSYAQTDLCSGTELVAHDITPGASIPEALRQMIGTRTLTEQRRSQSSGVLRKARAIRQGYASHASSTIGPLLQSVRDQEEPYNLLCPYYIHSNGRVSTERCLSGCVATSIEQIMAYYKYPAALLDTLHGWETPNYVIDDLLPGTAFDWDHYLFDYRNGWTEEQGMAIALPTLAAGMAVKMHYGLGSSAASTYTAVDALRRAFGYGMVRWADRVLYPPARWHAMLRHELANGRPIAYVGNNMEMSGHAFNIDGIDEQGYYHVNWGYNGCYDGWYDLDWLSPWEPYEFDADGMAYGFFSNQGALFMHPSADASPLEADSLDIDNLGIEVVKAEIPRKPLTEGYTAVDFTFKNTGTDDVTYTYEVFTYLPTDTAIFYQADYAGIAALNIPAGQTRTQRAFLKFHATGERLLGISHDDVTIPLTMPVTVEAGKTADIGWENLSYDITAPDTNDSGATLTATFTVDATNLRSDAYGSAIILYCLYEEGHADEDLRHFQIIDLPASQTQRLSVAFTHLKPATRYHFILRSPWTIRLTEEFTTPAATAVSPLPHDAGQGRSHSFDISGTPWTRQHGGIMIRDGKKWLTQ